MIYLFYIVLVLSFTTTAFFSMVFLNGWKSVVSTVLFVFNCLLLIGYVYSTLGKPLSIDFISSHLFNMKHMKVVWMGFVENKAIYLLLMKEGEPIYVKLPWNANTAETLQQMQRQAAKRGENGMPQGGDIEAESLETRNSKFKHIPPPKQRSELKPQY